MKQLVQPTTLSRRRMIGLLLACGVLLCIAAAVALQWNTEPSLGAAMRSVHALPGKPTALSFSVDGKLLVVATNDRAVHLYETGSGERVRTFPVATLPVGALAISPDGKFLAAVGTAGVQPGRLEFKLWSLADGTALYETLDDDHTPAGDGCTPFSFVAFSPDCSIMAIPARNRSVAIWDVRRQQVTTSCRASGVPSAVAFSPDGKTVAVATHTGECGGTAQVHDIRMGQVTGNLWSGIYSGGLQVVYSRDGQKIAAAFHHAYAEEHPWADSDHPDDTKLHWTWEEGEPKRLARSVAFCRGGRLLAVLTEDTRIGAGAEVQWLGHKRLFVRDAETGKELVALGEVDGPIAMSPDGKLLASGGDGENTILWRIE